VELSVTKMTQAKTNSKTIASNEPHGWRKWPLTSATAAAALAGVVFFSLGGEASRSESDAVAINEAARVSPESTAARTPELTEALAKDAPSGAAPLPATEPMDEAKPAEDFAFVPAAAEKSVDGSIASPAAYAPPPSPAPKRSLARDADAGALGGLYAMKGSGGEGRGEAMPATAPGDSPARTHAFGSIAGKKEGKRAKKKAKSDKWVDALVVEESEEEMDLPLDDARRGYDRQLAARRLTVGTHDDNGDEAGWQQFLSHMRGQMMRMGIHAQQIDAQPPGARHADSPENLDVVLVMDTTGSMGDELEYLKVELQAIAHEVTAEFPGVDQRWGMVAYRDHGDEYVTRVEDFREIGAFTHALGREHAGGGGDTPEAMDLAMKASQQLSWRKGEGTARLVFLVADAPPHHGAGVQGYMDAVEGLRSADTTLYPVAGSGVAHEAELLMRLGAKMTGGQYIFLTDHSGIGGHHAAPHVKDYQVETLHDAMRRMIRLELGDQAPALAQADPQPCGYALNHAHEQAQPSMWQRVLDRLEAHFTFAGAFAMWLFMALFIDTRLRRRREHIA
jgi:hypothetical protein